MNIRYNSRYLFQQTWLLTVLCWMLPIFFLLYFVKLQLFGGPQEENWANVIYVLLFILALWLFAFLKIKWLAGTRLTEEGILQPGWGGPTLMLWRDVSDVVVNLLPHSQNSVPPKLAFYFTDKNGGVIMVPVDLFADQDHTLDTIERRLPASVPRRLRTPQTR